MSTENNSPAADTLTPAAEEEVNLDDFSSELFNSAPQSKEDDSDASADEGTQENTDDNDGTDSNLDGDENAEIDDEGDNDVDPEDNDGLADEDGDDSEEEDGEDTPAAKPKKKSRFQERIDELTGKQKEAERKEEATARRLEEALAEIEKLKNPTDQNDQDRKDTPLPSAQSDGGPTPTDTNEDGTEKYPLGEFDPQYLKDLVAHTLETERQAQQVRDKETAQQRQQAEAQAALKANWDEKMAPAQERYPDFQEKGEQLLGTFEGIDASYGEYLTSTLMGMDYGPDVLYYLANNPDEATAIVNSGPVKATVSLGHIEQKFAEAADNKKRARPKSSNAPPPPPRNKGSSAAQATVPDDTDDLDAFNRKLFPKRSG